MLPGFLCIGLALALALVALIFRQLEGMGARVWALANEVQR